MEKYSFIVVGGGVAGTTCAERVKKKILNNLIIAKI